MRPPSRNVSPPLDVSEGVGVGPSSPLTRRSLVSGAALGAAGLGLLAADAPAQQDGGGEPVMLDPAKGDGQTDQSGYIQAIIDGLSADGGGEIVVPARVYICNVTILPNVYIRGGGWTSILKSNPGSSAPVIGSSKTDTKPEQDPYHCGVSMLRIDGNANNDATGRGI